MNNKIRRVLNLTGLTSYFFKMTNEEQPQESLISTDNNDEHDTTQLLADIAEQQLLDITEYLEKSEQEINRRKRIRKAVITIISSLAVVASIGFFWAMNLKENIRIIAKSNEIATKAYMQLENDPTLSFRLAEQAYKIYPTDLAKQVIMASYGKMPFYQLLKGNQLVKFSPDGKYIITVSRSTAWLWDRKGNELQIFNKMYGNYFNNHHFVNFSFKGQYIGLVKSDSTALIYDISHNKKHVLKGHTDHVKSVYFSSDDRFILTASDDLTISMWDMNFNKIQVLKGHTESVRFAKFSPDSKYILSASDDNTVRLWDIVGNQLKILKNVKFGEKYDANFSPDGNHVITTSYDNIARLWNLKNDEVTQLKGHKDVIWSAYFSPDGKYILTGSIDNTARLWDLQGNELLVYKEHNAKLWDAKFSPDGKHIVSISDDCTARLWDLQGHTLQILKGHASQLYDVNFSPDGKHIATSATDRTARIWNIKPKENPVLRGHFSWLEDANFSPDGNYIVTAGYDYVARIWNKQGHHIRALKGHQHYYMRTAKFSPDGQYIVTTSGDKTARLWNLDGEELVIFKGHADRVQLANFSSDGKYLLTQTWSIFYLWDLKGNELRVFKNADVNFSPDSKYIVASYRGDSIAYIYELHGEEAFDSLSLFYKIRGHTVSVNSVNFSPDGNYILTITGSTAWVWKFDPSESKVVQLINKIKNNKGDILFKNFSSDSKHFIATSSDNVARVYDVSSKQVQTLVGHLDDINSAGFSPDCKFIVTGSHDFTVRVWDMQGNELQVLPGHSATVMKVCFSNDGNYVLSASVDQTARLMPWRVEDVLHKINVEKVRGEVWQISDEDKKLYGIFD